MVLFLSSLSSEGLNPVKAQNSACAGPWDYPAGAEATVEVSF
jgi:hypothetical protein